VAEQETRPGPSRARRFRIVGLWAVAGALTLIVVTSLFLHYTKLALFLGGGCKDQIVSETASPDGKRKVVLHVRDCGATTRASTHVSVVRSNASGSVSASAEVLAGYEYPWNAPTHKIGTQWTDENHVDVWYADDVELTHLNDQVGSVHVHFELRRRPEPKQ
jgi:hypothetical protein